MQKIKALALCALVTIGLSGCFNSDLDRAAAGAAVGGAGAYVVGGSILTGVAAGALVGATCDEFLTVCN